MDRWAGEVVTVTDLREFAILVVYYKGLFFCDLSIAIGVTNRVSRISRQSDAFASSVLAYGTVHSSVLAYGTVHQSGCAVTL